MSPGIRIASSFTESPSRLTAQEQSSAKLAAFDLQPQGVSPGDRSHCLDWARDRNFRSVRVNADLRIIVHRGGPEGGSLLLCFLGHHDEAYRWAESRKIERRATTGTAQLVEIRETVRETVPKFVVPKVVEVPAAAQVPPAKLLRGVPREEVRACWGRTAGARMRARPGGPNDGVSGHSRIER